MYARFCVAWYGKRAIPVVREQIVVLEKRGDQSGVVAWSKVAEVLERMNAA